MIKLLLVEDDSTFSYIVKNELQEIIGGYEVITATNGAEGLKAWKEYHPDIIISDIDMPVMNGYQMVERIREMDGDIPILFTSALTSPKDVKEGYKLGVNNYVKKPFVPDELDAHIHAILKMKAGVKLRNENEHYALGRFTLDAKHATLHNNENGENKTLTVREAQILQLLCENIMPKFFSCFSYSLRPAVICASALSSWERAAASWVSISSSSFALISSILS